MPRGLEGAQRVAPRRPLLRRAPGALLRRLRSLPGRVVSAAVEAGVPPAWTGYRWVPAETPREYLAAIGEPGDGTWGVEVIHPERVFENPLPRNVVDRRELPSDRGWWGYSFHDVPSRTGGETLVARLPDCRVLPFVDPSNNQFYVTVVDGTGRVLRLREMGFQPGHAAMLRRASRGAGRRVERATWILERVFHNHSHWLTCHLPKLLLLRDRDQLGDVILPGVRGNPRIDESLRMIGIEPEDHARLHEPEPLHVEDLTVIDTDRLRPELIRSVRDAFRPAATRAPTRRVYISRENATRRRLLNEEEVWAVLRTAGFERVRMEDLSFADQVGLMSETSALFSLHGAGLTNMIFCPPGTAIMEIADLSFPNPNFYALASALEHPYWVIPGEPRGYAHPLDRDVWVEIRRVEQVVESVCSNLPSG